VDACGTITLESHEAERIRTLGFHSKAGLWRVPSLPAHLVAGNPLLEALGDDRDAFWRPRQSTSEPDYQAAGVVEGPAEQVGQVYNPGIQNRPMEVSLPDASETDCAAILAAVERVGGRIERRKLQKKLWRLKAEQFNRALESLRRRGLIQIDRNLVVALRIDQADSALFHSALQTNDAVPPGDRALGLAGAADRVSTFRGTPHAQHREEGD